MRYVVDASVVAKALLREADSAVADALIESHRDGRCSLLAPEIIVAEVANALWKRSHIRQQISADEARELLSDFLSLGLFLTPTSTLASAALQIATRESHSVYDCLYVALAESAACPFVTADEKLRAKLSAGGVPVLSLKSFVI
jgi:predicted nucleic acid-binding protein